MCAGQAASGEVEAVRSSIGLDAPGRLASVVASTLPMNADLGEGSSVPATLAEGLMTPSQGDVNVMRYKGEA